MVGQSDGGFLDLAGERAGTDVADGTDFEGNTAVGKKIHERWIMNSADAVAYTFDMEMFDGFTNFFWSADFAGVNEEMQAVFSGAKIDGTEVGGANTEFVSAHAEGDDVRGVALVGALDNRHGRLGTELTYGIEHPVHAQAAGGEGSDRGEKRLKIGLRVLATEKHDADGKSDFGVDDAL